MEYWDELSENLQVTVIEASRLVLVFGSPSMNLQ